MFITVHYWAATLGSLKDFFTMLHSQSEITTCFNGPINTSNPYVQAKL